MMPCGDLPHASPMGQMATSDVATTVRSRAYLALLVLAALVGAPISAIAYFFLQLFSHAQTSIFTDPRAARA